MAGTSDAWKTSNIFQNAGRVYRGMAVPAGGARPAFETDLTPLASSNPSALHIGATEEGSKVMVKPTLIAFNADEFRAPIVRNLDAVEMAIAMALLGNTDMQLLAYNLPGVGTRATASGYDYVTIGSKAIAYDCICLTVPLIEDTTKIAWVMVYNGINDSGIDFAVSRKKLGSSPTNYIATEVTSRSSTDTIGQIGKQI